MKRVYPLIAALALAASFPAAASETDIALGLTIDIAPFGIEYMAPQLGVFHWIGSESMFRPGAMIEVSYWGDRAAIAAFACARAGWEALSFFGGAGLTAYYWEDFQILPTLVAGGRLSLGALAFLPSIGVRIKEKDTDKDIRVLVGWTF